MHHHPARATYDQLENTLSSITLQLRSAIEADAGKPSRETETALPAGGAQRMGPPGLGRDRIDPA